MFSSWHLKENFQFLKKPSWRSFNINWANQSADSWRDCMPLVSSLFNLFLRFHLSFLHSELKTRSTLWKIKLNDEAEMIFCLRFANQQPPHIYVIWPSITSFINNDEFCLQIALMSWQWLYHTYICILFSNEMYWVWLHNYYTMYSTVGIDEIT